MDDVRLLIDPLLEQRGTLSSFEPEQSRQDKDGDSLGYNPQLQCAYDPQLEYDRRQKKEKLKQRFEHIFEKYERDFEGIGDEIDLKTGDIVVDNGHLAKMRNEADTGDSGLAREVVDGPEPELSENSSDEGANGDKSGQYGERRDRSNGSSETTSRNTSPGDFSLAEQDVEYTTPLFDIADFNEDVSSRNRPAKRKSMRDKASGARDIGDEDIGVGMTSGDILEYVPALKESMLNLRLRSGQGQSMDPVDIQALGMNIASQIATFMSHGSSSKQNQKHRLEDTTWSYPDLPNRPQSKRRRRTPSPYSAPEPADSPGGQSLWAPVRHPRQKRKHAAGGADLPDQQPQGGEIGPSCISDDGKSIRGVDGTPKSQPKSCTNCETTYSLVWRSGPDGNLCNACGMYLYRYGLMKPINPFLESDELATPDSSDSENDYSLTGYFASTICSISKRSAKNTRFEVQEDALLIRLKEIDQKSWIQIGEHFPGRSAYAVQCRYSKKLCGRPSEGRNYLIAQGYLMDQHADGTVAFQQPGAFTDEQDDLLLKLHDEDGLGWEEIAASLPNRSAEAVEKRFHEIAKQCLSQYNDEGRFGSAELSVKPKKKRNIVKKRKFERYSAEEDELIVKLREVDKLGWAELAERFPARNAMALQKRYVRELATKTQMPEKSTEDSLNSCRASCSSYVAEPQLSNHSLKNSRYTQSEDELLVYLKDVRGMKWEEVAESIPGRGVASLINRYQYKRMKGSQQVLAASVTGVPSVMDVDTSNTQIEAADEEPEVPQDSAEFNTDEDEHIIKFRKIENLQWPEIAAKMPGRTASSISKRYFQHLLPRQVSDLRVTGRGVSISPTNVISSRRDEATTPQEQSANRSSRLTADESAIVLELHEQGLSWEQIAAHVPCRTAKSVQTHIYTRFPQIKNRTGSATSSSLAQSAHSQRFRQDLNSDFQLRSKNAGGGSFVPGEWNEGLLPQLALPEEVPANQETFSPMYPESPLQRSDRANAFDANQGTVTDSPAPARLNRQSHPYFIGLPQSSFSPILNEVYKREKSSGFNMSETGPFVRSRTTCADETDTSVAEDTHRDTPLGSFDEACMHGDGKVADVDGEPETQIRKADMPLANVFDDAYDAGTYSTESIQRPCPRLHQEDEPVESIGQLEKPHFSWIALIHMALKASTPQPLQNHEICEYIEDNFDYYKDNNTCNWRASIRSSLSRCSYFTRASDDQPVQWLLSKDAPTTMAASITPSKLSKQSKTPRKKSKYGRAKKRDRSSTKRQDVSKANDEETQNDEVISPSVDQNLGGSSPGATRASDRLAKIPPTAPSNHPKEQPESFSSSSTTLSKETSLLATVNRKSTSPRNTSLTLPAHRQKRPSGLPSDIQAELDLPAGVRSSSIGRFERKKRVICTPVKQNKDDSEDELA